MKKAIVLLSGGLDSAVVLALALQRKLTCIALSFDYGQRHVYELSYAKILAQHYNVEHIVIKIDSSAFRKSALVENIDLPRHRTLNEISQSKIPSTYVPARNTIFIAYAIAQAEIHEASEIHFGPNALDYHAYVDCRPEYIQKYQELIDFSTKQAIQGHSPRLVTPLIQMTKQEIVKKGIELNIPIHQTWSCYDPTKELTPCQICDACIIRQNALSI